MVNTPSTNMSRRKKRRKLRHDYNVNAMTTISIQIPDDLRERAERLAYEQGTSLDAIFLEALENRLGPQGWPKWLHGREVVDPRQVECPFPESEPDL